jgi:hypothetical protein
LNSFVTIVYTHIAGVGFRFEDIRSLYYTEFAKGKEVVPDLHFLTQNFRTHSGICNMASSVVEPLLHFFPESIDKLKRETGVFDSSLLPIYNIFI